VVTRGGFWLSLSLSFITERRKGEITMRQILIKKKITYQWLNSEGDEIKREHVESLERSAEAQIAKMMAEGYLCGKLHGEIVSFDGPDTTTPATTEYYGWWKSSTSRSADE
jgi:hypothetical protein